LYNEFLAFISGKDYTYSTKSERALEALKAEATKENYFDAIKVEYDHLLKRMEDDKKEDLKKYRDQIEELLKMEIVTRYYYQKGKIEAAMKNDPQITEAKATLKDDEKYSAILSGKFVQPKPEVPVKSDTDDDQPIE
jgi:carboxyl-terminal processing protease